MIAAARSVGTIPILLAIAVLAVCYWRIVRKEYRDARSEAIDAYSKRRREVDELDQLEELYELPNYQNHSEGRNQ